MASPPAPAADRPATSPRRAALLTWLAVLVVTSLPYAVAAWRPPPGRAFSGAFFYLDDFHQYLSFIEQAARGALPFHNKFDGEPHAPALVNLEWTAQGLLAALLGRDPVAGYHAFRPLALAALVFGAARLMALAGLAGGRLGWALALFVTGGGLGVLQVWRRVPGWQIPDVLMSLYPAHQALLNAHTALGSALLIWTLAFHLEWRAGRRGAGWWVATGWALGLTRPYDVVTFGLVAAALAAADCLSRGRRPHGWRRLLGLLGLAPVVLYYPLLMAVQPSFAGWQGGVSGDINPPLLGFLFALGPAAALAILGWERLRRESRNPELPWALAAWAVALAVVLVGVRSPMMKTFVSSFGVVLLLLASLSLPRPWLPAATLALSPTSMYLLWLAFHPPVAAPAARTWLPVFPPEGYFTATAFLNEACAPGEVAVAPTDLSLMIAGRTPCSVRFGFRGLTPDLPARVAEGERFYHQPGTPAAWRLDYLKTIRASWLVLPAGGGPLLGGDPPYLPRLVLPELEVWEAVDRAPPR